MLKGIYFRPGTQAVPRGRAAPTRDFPFLLSERERSVPAARPRFFSGHLPPVPVDSHPPWSEDMRQHLILGVAFHRACTSFPLAQTAADVIRSRLNPSPATVLDCDSPTFNGRQMGRASERSRRSRRQRWLAETARLRRAE